MRRDMSKDLGSLLSSRVSKVSVIPGCRSGSVCMEATPELCSVEAKPEELLFAPLRAGNQEGTLHSTALRTVCSWSTVLDKSILLFSHSLQVHFPSLAQAVTNQWQRRWTSETFYSQGWAFRKHHKCSWHLPKEYRILIVSNVVPPYARWHLG